jgi:DNA-binding Xre family transcriptional regulator
MVVKTLIADQLASAKSDVVSSVDWLRLRQTTAICSHFQCQVEDL